MAGCKPKLTPEEAKAQEAKHQAEAQARMRVREEKVIKHQAELIKKGEAGVMTQRAGQISKVISETQD